MRPSAQVLVQRFVLCLVGPNGNRAVGVVLQPLLQAGVAGQRESQRVVGAERDPALEAALERRLDRVVQVPELRRVLVDGRKPLVSSEQVLDVGVRPRRGPRDDDVPVRR